MGMIHTINRWMATLNYRVALYERCADPAASDFVGPCIFVFWHEYMLLPLYLRPRCRLAMLLSQHQDAELLFHAAHFAGLGTIRGSTHRGATAALRKMLEQGQGMNLAITPDGPRGPRRQLAAGCIYLASRLQVPIIAMGGGYDRPWRNHRAWDRFAIPRPFSKSRVVCGPRLHVPADLERDQIEDYRVWVEQILNLVTETAERWAAGEIQLEPSELLYRKSVPHSAARS